MKILLRTSSFNIDQASAEFTACNQAWKDAILMGVIKLCNQVIKKISQSEVCSRELRNCSVLGCYILVG